MVNFHSDNLLTTPIFQFKIPNFRTLIKFPIFNSEILKQALGEGSRN